MFSHHRKLDAAPFNISLQNTITSKWETLHLNQTLDESHPTWLSKITLFQPDQLRQQM
jgi:hypothetical protein